MEPMRRESPYSMVQIEEAQRLIAEHTPLLEAELVDAFTAQTRVLAESIIAREDVPDVPKAAVDGYALRAADGMQARQVVAELTAGGARHLLVEPGMAVRIMTGAPLPPGADTVIMVEQTEESGGMVRIERALQEQENIHAVGKDLRQGITVIERGTVLTPPMIGLLATVGQSRVRVFRRPRVAVLATGDEVFEPDALPGEGGIRDSNRYALLAAARAAGCEAISLGIARDEHTVQRNAILRGIEQADVVLTSGGVSMGTRDLIKPLLAELGTVHFGRVMFKPGKPTTFASVNGRLVFGLPGYPVSSLVSFEVFVRPLLRRMQGDQRPERPRIRVVLAEPANVSIDRPEYQRAVVSVDDGQLHARTTGAQGSSRLLSLRDANALLIVPPRPQPYPAGETLEALLTGELR